MPYLNESGIGERAPSLAAPDSVSRVHQALVLALILWMTYSATGFRMPTTPIVVSDSNAGSSVRQVLFAATWIIAVIRLLTAGALSRVIANRPVELALMGLLFASAMWSTLPALTIKRSFVFFFGLTALITVTHGTRRPVELMQRMVFGFTATIAWVSLLGWVALPRICVENANRPGLAGVATHPNTLAPFLAAGFMISLGFRSQGYRGLAQRVGQAGLLIAIFMTGSVTSIALLAVCLGAYAYLIAPRSSRGSMNLVFSAVGALIAVVGFNVVKTGVLEAAGRDASLSGRDVLWARVLEEVYKYPLLGHGYGAFWTEGKGRELVTTWNPRQAHHAYIDVLTDLGAVGLAVVLLAFPLRGILHWQHAGGFPRTAQRRAAASLLALSLGITTSYALTQSFYFKMDSFPFFILMWCLLLLSNKGSTSIAHELAPTASARQQPAT